ncbi:unnamed protein product [Discula destructiva]
MGKTEIAHSAALPAGVSKQQAIALLHDHVAFFKAAEFYREHTEHPEEAKLEKVPAEIKARSVGGASGTTAKAYSVRSEVPNPIRDSSVDSMYVVVDLVDGMWYAAASPMGVKNEALWTVKEAAGGLELSVVLNVECNVMLKSVVKGQSSTSSQQILDALVKKLQG